MLSFCMAWLHSDRGVLNDITRQRHASKAALLALEEFSISVGAAWHLPQARYDDTHAILAIRLACHQQVSIAEQFKNH